MYGTIMMRLCRARRDFVDKNIYKYVFIHRYTCGIIASIRALAPLQMRYANDSLLPRYPP